MAKTIILVRHSYAENSSFQTKDLNRALTIKGVQHAQCQSILLADVYNKIDLLVSSDANRAMQTAEIFREELEFNTEIHQEHFLYKDYTTQYFMDFIYAMNDSLDTIMVIGHNPTLANIAYRLSPDFNHGVSPGTIIIIEFPGKSWSKIGVGQGTLVKVIA